MQVVVWILGWPAVAALLIASDPRGSRRRYAAAVVVLVLGGSVVAQAATDDTDDTDTAPATAESAQHDAEAAAAERIAAADAAARRAAAEDAEEAEAAEAAEAAERAAEATRVAAAEREAEEAAAEAAAQAAAAAATEAAAAATWTVYGVVDGDTVDVRAADGTEERVRVIGIDTPERGECGFGEAGSALAALVLDQQVTLTAGARDDRDRYDRVLRYVDVGDVDAGLRLIEDGLAIARYDSRDGYGRHDREAAYVAADAATAQRCTTPAPEPSPASEPAPAPAPPPASGPGSGPNGAWKNCTEARENGAAPVRRGDPGYGSHLDRDDDGVGCE